MSEDPWEGKVTFGDLSYHTLHSHPSMESVFLLEIRPLKLEEALARLCPAAKRNIYFMKPTGRPFVRLRRLHHRYSWQPRERRDRLFS